MEMKTMFARRYVHTVHHNPGVADVLTGLESCDQIWVSKKFWLSNCTIIRLCVIESILWLMQFTVDDWQYFSFVHRVISLLCSLRSRGVQGFNKCTSQGRHVGVPSSYTSGLRTLSLKKTASATFYSLSLFIVISQPILQNLLMLLIRSNFSYLHIHCNCAQVSDLRKLHTFNWSQNHSRTFIHIPCSGKPKLRV